MFLEHTRHRKCMCWMGLHPDICPAFSLTSNRSWLKCHLLNDQCHLLIMVTLFKINPCSLMAHLILLMSLISLFSIDPRFSYLLCYLFIHYVYCLLSPPFLTQNVCPMGQRSLSVLLTYIFQVSKILFQQILLTQ